MKISSAFAELSFPICLICCVPNCQAQLTASDGLGRKLPTHEEVGGVKADRNVAIFYFLWQGHERSPTSGLHWDLDVLWRKTPEVFEDFDHERWGTGAGVAGKYYFWGESIYGYYRGDDYWVHLRNVQLLTDAGIDILILDATNRITYLNEAYALMKALDAVKKQGKETPKIVFYTNTRSVDSMQEIYDHCYREDAPYRFAEHWFYLEGKPLIIGHKEAAVEHDYASFFTIRQSQWPNEAQKVDGWPWIDFHRPQKVHYNHRGEAEIINISVAQHPDLSVAMGGAAFYGSNTNWGRSYRDGGSGNPDKDIRYGYNFQEQWDYAIEQNPPFIFVTGWNEWIVGKWKSIDGNDKHSLFVDQASPEYSRDIEPTRTGNLEDHYYMQLAANVRRYKGVEPNPALSERKTIRHWDDWTDVQPEYNDYVGDADHRRHPGAQSQPLMMYNNVTGRNDIRMSKVARDDRQLFFLVETVAPIQKNNDKNWMNLYVNIDRSAATGWYGYDYRIVDGRQLQRYTGVAWENQAKLTCRLEGDKMMISIPREELACDFNSLNFEFKWSDNMQEDHPLDWYINGDAAPGGRFNFLVKTR